MSRPRTVDARRVHVDAAAMMHEAPVTIVDVEVHADGGALLELSDGRRLPVRALHAFSVSGGATPRVSVDDGFAAFDAAPFVVGRVADACRDAGLVVVRDERVVGGDAVVTSYVVRPASPEWLMREPESPARRLAERLLALLPTASLSLFTPGAWPGSAMRVAIAGVDDALVAAVVSREGSSRVAVSFAGSSRVVSLEDAVIADVVAFVSDVAAERVVVARAGAVCAWCGIDRSGALGEIVEVVAARSEGTDEIRSLQGTFDRRLRPAELERLATARTAGR